MNQVRKLKRIHEKKNSVVYFDSFSQFLHNMGMPKIWAMTDVFGLDDELLAMIPQPVSALLLLFPINAKVLIQRHLK